MNAETCQREEGTLMLHILCCVGVDSVKGKLIFCIHVHLERPQSYTYVM
jgi:hypothetical protein